MATPNKYSDPYWSALSEKMERKFGLPEKLLTNIVVKGERSNNDQVSEAGARTPFQIIPETRQAILKKYGVDPYLNPEAAAEGAALLLKESIDRNKGNVKRAVAEYHGGTDPKNWGPRTKSYVQRVIGEDLEAANKEILDPRKQVSESTFQRALAKQDASKKHTESIANVLNAYKEGRLSQEDAQRFETDVNEGLIMLPPGEKLEGKETSPIGAQIELPEGVARAYQSGKISAEDKAQIEKDVAAGLVKPPKGLVVRTPMPELGFFGGIKEAVTGEARATEATRTLPEWVSMPELNELSMASAKTGLGTMFAAPDEIVEVIKANFPQTRIRQDEKGNYILSSSIDGADYVIPPGVTVGDIPRIIGGGAAFTPAGRATSILGGAASAGATQAAIEASQSATGGTFNPADVALAAAVGGATPPVVQGVKAISGAIASPIKAAISKVSAKGAETTRPSAVASQTSDVVSPTPIQPQQPNVIEPLGETVLPTAAKKTRKKTPLTPAEEIAPAQQPTSPIPEEITSSQVQTKAVSKEVPVREMAQTAVKAGEGGFGSKKALQKMVEMAAPDQETIESAERLGVLEYLQADHVSTNRTFRDIAQAAKGVIGSEAKTQEAKGLEKVAERADNLIKELGGIHDVSTVNVNIKKKLQDTHDKLKADAAKIYNEIDEKLLKTASAAPAPNVIKFVKERAKTLGGEKFLTAGEKKILKNLAPAGEAQVEPTYALLDQTRKEIGAAKRGAQNAFGNADAKLLGELEGALRADQANVAKSHRLGTKWEKAQSLSRLYKGMQDDMVALFGKALDESIVGDLSAGVSGLAKGDTSKFIKLLKAVPESMRQELVASGLATAFGKTAKQQSISFTSYYKWYEGLMKNQQAYTALMSNLPKEARQSLSDLYKVSKGIAMASKEYTPTGRLLTAQDAFKGGETLAAKIYDAAKHHYQAVGAGLAANVLFPGLGVVVSSVLSKGAKQPAIHAADKLFASPDFKKAVIQAAQGKSEKAAKDLAKSSVFTNFVKKSDLPEMENMADKERWILDALEEHAKGVVPKKQKKEK